MANAKAIMAELKTAVDNATPEERKEFYEFMKFLFSYSPMERLKIIETLA